MLIFKQAFCKARDIVRADSELAHRHVDLLSTAQEYDTYSLLDVIYAYFNFLLQDLPTILLFVGVIYLVIFEAAIYWHELDTPYFML
ncbi:hypothetical protein EUX98_g1088 [Antrodiella citrinella]|uniref:Uncharacterized protein n=1 Tax=Antrodiella citrinella TaxID=2447956 RepID=A0A4S4N272_9APHY|nr:hypothetical protein EUX98_g1088 [Antrodiella citrinella]